MMKRIIFILVSVIALASCRSDMQGNDALLDRGIKVFRYDRLQYEATAMNSIAAVQRMNLDCPQATRILIEDVLMLGKVNDPNINERMCAYYADSILFRLMQDAEEKFSDMRPIEEKLTKGFKRLKEEVPSIPIPSVYSQISALNQSIVVGDSLLGFSLDKYMGEDYPLYKRYYYAYQRRSMKPERILPDCFTFYLMSQYPFGWERGRRTLFDVIMHQGKINWVARKALEIKSNAEMLDYTKEETEWCKKNEKALWNWMVSRKHLESTDPMIIRAYTHPDPNIILKGERIPPVIGIWIGMQLTEKFMKEHPDMSIKALLECEDFRELTLE